MLLSTLLSENNMAVDAYSSKLLFTPESYTRLQGRDGMARQGETERRRTCAGMLRVVLRALFPHALELCGRQHPLMACRHFLFPVCVLF